MTPHAGTRRLPPQAAGAARACYPPPLRLHSPASDGAHGRPSSPAGLDHRNRDGRRMTAYGDRRRAGAYAKSPEEDPVKTTSKARRARRQTPAPPTPEPAPDPPPDDDDGDDGE